MTLEDPDTVDSIKMTGDGRVTMTIYDHGSTKEPAKRLELLKKKIKRYFRYVIGKEFQQKYVKEGAKGITIKVVCSDEPTEEMRKLSLVTFRGFMDIKIPVVFEVVR